MIHSAREDTPSPPAVVLWDFGDTLVDERWMRRSPPSCPNWESVWVGVMSDLADLWNVAELSSADVYAVLAQRSGLSVDEVAGHAAACCENLMFHSAAWAAASARLCPQAIVTVNPDLFEQCIVPGHRLDEVFDAIVTSCTERTDDKVRLCEIALDRLEYDGPRGEVLLVDNRLDLVRAWETSGGQGYWFRGDDQFAQDRSSLGL